MKKHKDIDRGYIPNDLHKITKQEILSLTILKNLRNRLKARNNYIKMSLQYRNVNNRHLCLFIEDTISEFTAIVEIKGSTLYFYNRKLCTLDKFDLNKKPLDFYLTKLFKLIVFNE